ncbi:RHS repeat-associated core domain-containing protein [Alteromonas sp. CNT1-28]|jgi:hypothetical protein|nr:RHS repeat-associated core domain-containing protein [Alteromonas sp. CNT1-28]USI30221.1 RHS repeat-associated core domain-containing protein [Alteromonas macleodii]
MQARYYDPVIGRFYSNDPVNAATFLSQGNIQGFNRYAYANNNPYKFTDPTGMSPEMEVEMPDLGQVLANAFGFDSANQATETVQSGIDTVNQSVDTVGSELASRTSVTASGTAGHGLGVTASTTADSQTLDGQGVELEGSLTGTAYGASVSATANFTVVKPDANATGPVTSTTVMGGSGLGGGATIQWTPSLGVTVHAGPVAGFSVSSKAGGVKTRVLEKAN